jgi:hypothetical protein
LLAKCFAHEPFFRFELQHEAYRNQSKGNKAAPFANGNRRTEDCQQQPAVNRVADKSIRAGTDEFVILLNGDNAAPIAAEMAARPNCQGQPAASMTRPIQ